MEKVRLTLIGSRSNDQQSVTRFAIDTDVQTLNVSNNTTDISTFENIQVMDGTFSLSVSAEDTGSDNPYGYLNGLILERLN